MAASVVNLTAKSDYKKQVFQCQKYNQISGKKLKNVKKHEENWKK